MNELEYRTEATHWNTLGTVLWGLVIFGVLLLGQGIGLVSAIGRYSDVPLTLENFGQVAKAMEHNGNVLTWVSIIGLVLTVPVILLVIKFKVGSRIRNYLALNAASLMAYLKWIAVMIVTVLVMGYIGTLLGEESADRFTADMINSADSRFLLYIAVAVCAPVLEELFFRGFLYKGLAEGPLRPMGAILLTSGVWAAMHVQYGWYPILMIFVMGIVLGLARWKTNSLYVPIVMHALNNFAAIALFGVGS